MAETHKTGPAPNDALLPELVARGRDPDHSPPTVTDPMIERVRDDLFADRDGPPADEGGAPADTKGVDESQACQECEPGQPNRGMGIGQTKLGPANDPNDWGG